MKKPLILLVTTLFSLHGFAQGTDVKSSIDDPLLPVYIIATVILVIIILLIVVAFCFTQNDQYNNYPSCKRKSREGGNRLRSYSQLVGSLHAKGKCFCPCRAGKNYRIRSQLRWYQRT